MIGKDDPGVDAEGCAGAHSANRVAQYIDLRHQQIRMAVEQVHREEEGSTRNPIAAIIRHAGSMPQLWERRNALRFSTLRLLSPHQQKEAIKRRDQGNETLAEIARSYNVSPATISQLTA
jgi:hypothetical protein